MCPDDESHGSIQVAESADRKWPQGDAQVKGNSRAWLENLINGYRSIEGKTSLRPHSARFQWDQAHIHAFPTTVVWCTQGRRGLASGPAVIRWQLRFTMDKLPVRHRTDINRQTTYSHPRANRSNWLINFDLWEKAGQPGSRKYLERGGPFKKKLEVAG